MSGGRNSPTTVQISSPGSPAASNARPPSPATAARPLPTPPPANPFATLQKSLQPVDLLASDRAPSSPEAMEVALHAWWDSIAPSIEDRRELEAIGHYVRATIGHLKRTDCRHVLDYHRSCATAGAKGLYHPFRDGDVYPLAYAQHIGPYLFSAKGPSRSSRDWAPKGGKDRKRKADSSTSDAARCDLPGHGAHTVAECYTRHPELRVMKGEGQRGAPSSAKKRKAAADEKDT